METKKRIRLKIASPCPADWNSMKGDDAVRHCASCKKSVYQISNMSTEQVEALLAESGEEKCVRFYQRKDGTLLTADCTVGLRRKRRKQAVIGAGMGVLSALGVGLSGAVPASPSDTDVPAVQEIVCIEGTAVPDVVVPDVVVPDVVVPDVVVPDVATGPEYEQIMGAMVAYEIEDEPATN